MVRKIVKMMLRSMLVTFLFFGTAELLTRIVGMKPSKKWDVRVTPHNFFVADTLLGWTLAKGRYTLTVLDTSNKFTANINANGERLSSGALTKDESNKPSVHMYGCSFIFGFSVEDTATSSYKLQTLLPDYKVINKGVPGYGLTQMYLSLKESLTARDTPAVAIFNYAYFHDDRTPLCREWNSCFRFVLSRGNADKYANMNYPYMQYEKGRLKLRLMSFDEPAKDWPLRSVSSFVNLLNTVYNLYADGRGAKHRHLITEQTAVEMVAYCKRNHIIPVFANVTPENTDTSFFKLLSRNGSYTVDYGVQVLNDRDTATRYNCAPYDPWHPSGYAHTVYAEKLFHFITDTIRLKRILER